MLGRGCGLAPTSCVRGSWTWNWTDLLCEGRLLLQLHHPHVVQVMGFTQFMSKCIMVMELMDSDLRQFIKIRSRDGMRPFTWFEELDIITQIARGLLYLHEQDRYMKGEVKCSNILVKQIGDAILVKIMDLRSSQKRIYSQRAAQAASPKLVIFNFFYKPWKGRELLKKADVYSFGMVCFEVLTGRLPFSNVGGDALERLVATGEMKPELPADMEPRLRALIKSCLARASHKRPTLDQICHRLGVIKSSKPGFFARVHRLLQMASLGVSQDMARASQLAASAESQDSAGASRSDCRPQILADCARIEPEKLKIERFLGRGASAEVHQATWLDCKVAVKTFNSSVSPAEVQAEVKFLTELRHHCVVRMLGLSVSKSGRRCSIVMEFMGSDLRKLIDSRMKINKTAPFEIHEAVYIITRIALGMLFLHTRGVAHRDLKSLNVLVPDHPASIEVKIADFGVSQLIGPNGDHTLRTVGTGFWRAPELLLAPPRGDDGEPLRSYDLKAADVYSFAMTSYEVVTGKVPLDDEEVTRLGLGAAKRKVIAGVLRPELPDGLNPVLKELIEECWAGKPEKRPTFSTICAKLRQIQRGELAGEPCFVPKKRSWTWWAKGELLGSGTFGTVYEGVGSDGTVFAVKLLPFSNLGRAGIQETRPLEQEIALLCRIQHPNIVEYLGTERDDEKLYIFQELVSNGSLADEYNRCKMFNDQIRSYTKQILSGLKYLHDRKIIHRDIKCANVLVGSSGVVKLADVGIMAKQTDKLALLKSSMAGSVHWMAPEVVNPNRRYRFKADIWSLGCTVLEMAIGGPPLGELEVHDVIWKVGHGEGPPLPDDLPDDIRSFISSCLEVNVALRPTCDVLMTHPFITGAPMTDPVKLVSIPELSSTADERIIWNTSLQGGQSKSMRTRRSVFSMSSSSESIAS